MSRVKSNPLSTRFVQPGRIPWQAVDSIGSLEHLANYFTCKLNWRAAIVGPHGSGKSTLLEHLLPMLGEVATRLATYELPSDMAPQATLAQSLSSQSQLPSVLAPRTIVWLKMRGRAASAKLIAQSRTEWRRLNRLLVVDGYEQLSWLSRARVVTSTARNGAGLLLTSHRPTCLPTLIKTQVDAQLARQLLERLLPEDLPGRERLLDRQRLEECLAQHQGNLREVFMQLYDEIETGRMP